MRTLDGPAVSCVVQGELRFAVETDGSGRPRAKGRAAGILMGMAHTWGPQSHPRLTAPEAHAQSAVFRCCLCLRLFQVFGSPGRTLATTGLFSHPSSCQTDSSGGRRRLQHV